MKKELAKVLIKRVSTSLVVLFLLITFVFFLLRISPGDPSQKFISPQLNPELAKKVRESFNLNSSLPDQYKAFIENLAKRRFGNILQLQAARNRSHLGIPSFYFNFFFNQLYNSDIIRFSSCFINSKKKKWSAG